METFDDFLETIENPDQRKRVAEVLDWITETFPSLERKIAWNQPMFTHHGTYIIGLSVSKHHFSLSPEVAGITPFAERITNAGYTQTKGLFRIKWTDEVDKELLRDMIEFNIADKAEVTTFWR